MMREFIKKLLPPEAKIKLKNLKTTLFGDRFSIKSYSQEGEDMILKRVFENQKSGFFVDVGAHHPFRFSNTYYFYKLGWHGVNIDALPGSMKLFNRHRSRDVNLEIPIGNSNKLLNYYVFNDYALNTFSESIAKKRDGIKGHYIKNVIKLRPQRLSEVLDTHAPQIKKIDFLSIDVEGLDFDVLQSNNWSKYRPKFILTEVLGEALSDIKGNEITLYLEENGYSIFAKTMSTAIFLQK